MTPQVLTANGGRAAVPASIRQPSWYSQSQFPPHSTLPTLRFCPSHPTDEPTTPIDFSPNRLSCYKPSHRDRLLQLQAEADVLLNYLKQINQQRLQQESTTQSAHPATLV